MAVGAAIHSVRALPRAEIPTVVKVATYLPLHVHLSEQPAENAACLARYGCTPTEVLDETGALGPDTTAVHATHLTANDVERLRAALVTACICPTTERDLADGVGPARELLHESGPSLSLGSDQHVVIDMFEEARALELDDRLISLRRGRFSFDELHAAMSAHRSIGWPDAGHIVVGARADLVAVRLDSVRTAGTDPDQVLLAASAADVDTVLVDGETIVTGGRHRLGDVAALLSAAIDPLWRDG
jgi:cytosine/adenosine deaminase-related metal-dependent hydrolase